MTAANSHQLGGRQAWRPIQRPQAKAKAAQNNGCRGGVEILDVEAERPRRAERSGCPALHDRRESETGVSATAKLGAAASQRAR